MNPGLRDRLPPPLLALALAAFAIGTTEFVIVGLLPAVAATPAPACRRPGCW